MNSKLLGLALASGVINHVYEPKTVFLNRPKQAEQTNYSPIPDDLERIHKAQEKRKRKLLAKSKDLINHT